MVGVTPWLLVNLIPLLPVVVDVCVHPNGTQEMELCACVCAPPVPIATNSINALLLHTALDPCVNANNGGCDRNAKCVMTGPGLVSL